ncbi:MAG: hypothetical protein J5958_02345 [Clostridia bacterium]|nr:hypothetical protein [Clostridia bacterium]
MNICYWNIHKNCEKQNDEFNTRLVELLEERSVDLFCISEFDRFDDNVLLDNDYELVDETNSDKVKCYKKCGLAFTQIRIDDRYAIIEHKNRKLLLVCIHSYDAINYDEYKRLHCMEDIKMEIDDYIKHYGETSVFVLGDFNCMPYDSSIMDEDVFNCVLYRDLLNTRVDAKERYYNPMLLLLSENPRIYGTFYSDHIQQRNLRWYLLDQVMINRNADKIMNYDSIRIIDKVKETSLLKNNKPNTIVYSDHLPLYFEIKED